MDICVPFIIMHIKIPPPQSEVLPSPVPACRQNSSQVTYRSPDKSAEKKGYGFTDPNNTNLWVNAAVYLQMGFLHIPDKT